MSNLVGATTAVFPVHLSIASNEIINVGWRTIDGTAKGGIDYQALDGVVRFLPGEIEGKIEVLVYGGMEPSAADSSKIFYIRLDPPSGAILESSLLACKIIVDVLGEYSVVSVIVAEGRRGLKGEAGRSAYEQAVYMGLFTGTVEQWMQQIADASSAADRAENAAVVANSKVLAEELRAEAAERSLQSSIELKAPQLTTFTKTEVTGLVEPKADKTYVDTALSGFTNGASKFYATLAAANTDIANIGIKDKVDIGEVANGGTWYKAAAGAVTLTKSAYDPLAQANAFTKVEVSATERSAKMYTDYRVDVANNSDDLHHFADKSGDIVAAIKSDGTLDVLNLTINGEILKHENDSEPLHVFTSKDGDIALSLNEDGRLLGAKPYDLGIDSLFAKATNDKELTKIGFYHDYVKASQQTAYNFSKTAYTINDPSDAGIVTPETMIRMPSIQVINKNKLFVSWASYRTGNSSDQSHAAMLGRFVTFDTETNSASVDTATVAMSGDRVSDPLAHRHAVFGTVLNKATGKPRHLCLYNTGSVNNSNGKLMIIHSDDDCKTWSIPRLIWGEESGNEWGLIPASLVRINKGIYQGRLVTTCFRFSTNTNTSSVAIVYSDDDGATWRVGGKIQQGAFDTPEVTFGFLNEAMINLDNQGNLILAIRNEGVDALSQRVLLWARSYDGGNTLVIEDEPHLETGLAEGSLLQAAEQLQDGIPKLLYSYPSAAIIGAQAYTRRNMRVAVSYDNGKTFPVYWNPRSGSNDPTGYSHLVKTSDQDFILVEERNQAVSLTFFNMSHIIKEGFINV